MHVRKLALISAMACTLGVLPSHAANILWDGGNGNWTDSNWFDGTNVGGPPTASDSAIWGGFRNASTDGTLTLDNAQTVSETNADRTSRTLSITSTGTLNTGKFNLLPVNNTDNSDLTVDIAGTLNASNTINIDSSSSDTAVINVNGGAINANASSGAGFQLDGPGTTLNINANSSVVSQRQFELGKDTTVNINGSGSTISANTANFKGLQVTDTGNAINYTFDTAGVSNMSVGRLSFETGKPLGISVDADLLAGGAVGDEILLIDYNNWRLDGNDETGNSFLSLINFTDNSTVYTGSLVQDTANTQLLYKISTVVPEPASLALVSLGGMLMIGRGRRQI
jgi:hypothetical protein